MKKNLLFIISAVLLIYSVNIDASNNRKSAVKLESVVRSVPWEGHAEPRPLPENWKKHRAKQTIIVDYAGSTVTIPRGDTYFTYKGSVAIGWHGTYNPPCSM